MKVIESEGRYIYYKTVKTGDAFLHGSDLYMKTDMNSTSNGCTYSVNVRSGNVVWFKDDAEVRIGDVEVILNE